MSVIPPQLGSNESSRKIGVLLVGHGTRNKAGQAEFVQLFQQVRQLLLPVVCELAFLELAEPTIEQGIQSLAKQGVQDLITVPAILFTAGHAQSDIPDAVQQAAQSAGLVPIGQTDALECSPEVLELAATRFRQAVCGQECLHGCSNKFCSNASWLMIGRGSSSASATEMTREFCCLRWRDTPARFAQVAFIHGQRPTVEEAMDEISNQECSIVVIQPHLLFSGLLMDQLTEQVAKRQSENPHQKWVITGSLGADSLLAELMAKRAMEAIERVHSAS